MKKRKLRIVFMGTPEFAVSTLKLLIEKDYNVVGVITATDKPSGRGRKLKSSAVKTYAKSKNLKILQPTNLKNEAFITELRSLNANLQIVVAFRMLPRVVWEMPEYGTFNLHASLLPNYRGAAPINWVLINGETKTGVSTFFIDDKIDTGEMILQEEVAIKPDENAGELHDKLMVIGGKLVIKSVELIQENTIKTTPQPQDVNLKTANKLNKDNCRINWSMDVHAIYNLVRGLSPYPGSWSFLQNNDDALTVKVFEVEREVINHNKQLGSMVVSKNEVKVAASNGFVYLKEIQLPGKRKMDIKSLLNGYQFDEKAIMY